MKHKGGNVYGSIYERKRKNGGISYTAEIQFQGQTMRRTSKDKAKLEEWKDSICNKLNSVLDRYNAELGEQLAIVKNKLYAEMIDRAKTIMDEAKLFDLRNKVCAESIGLRPKTYFQTYLARSNANGLIKIGKSKDIHTRMQVLSTKKVQLIGYVDRDIEVHLHSVYNAKRVQGEWFRLSDEEVDGIIKTFGFETPGVVFISGGGVD